MKPRHLALLTVLILGGFALGMFWQSGSKPASTGAGYGSGCPSFSDASNSSSSVSASTSTTILAGDANRVFASVVKADSGDLWLTLGSTANATSGILLSGKGASFETCEYKGPITGIAAGATSTVVVTYR